MTLQTALAQGAKLLNEGAVAVPKLTAEVLLAHAIRQERIYLVAHANDELPEVAWIHYGRYLHEKLKGKPTQYITKRQEFYKVMVDDCDRLLGTVEQVLRAGRLRAPHEKGRFHPVDLSKVLDDCLSLAQTRYRLTPGELTYRATLPSGARPQVLGDEEDLKAVILNLVDNAIKYSGDKVNVAVELAQTSARAATIRVSDHGVGIPVSELSRIFKRFYRIPGTMTSRIKGAGLGLFIVRAVVARHGGTVFAESDGPGLGTTFTVQLPLTSSPS